jgi:hypothetical protein
MSKKINVSFLLIAVIFPIFLISNSAKANNPIRYSDRFVVKSMQRILNAQVTYNATLGNGNYGSNLDLLEAGFIDAVLANGNKYGYQFVYHNSPRIENVPSRFYVTATPQRYGKTTKLSFYVDQNGELRGADRNGEVATSTDPFIDFCADYQGERCTLSDLRALQSAQITYQATVGSGNFGNFTQLRKANLIRQNLAVGVAHGYNFIFEISDQFPNVPASFKLFATPVNYGTSGTRSFYISVDGVLRGADKNGQRADENDPPIDF